ncbi:hypothetical protein, partial [Stutzerimonas stutzeri]|uniref:hypothetical protein n=1 Tax=Stutzerimonas stutzeri TaxID=316 RepID=UPI003C6FFB12
MGGVEEQRLQLVALEPILELLDMPMGQRAMARGVGVDLDPIEADRAQREQAHFCAMCSSCTNRPASSSRKRRLKLA